jgi:hypothetical protein
MDTATLIHGDSIERAVQHIIGTAFRKHTAEAMRHAAARVSGISCLLTFQELDTRHGSDIIIRLQNEIHRCDLAADMIEQGKL